MGRTSSYCSRFKGPFARSLQQATITAIQTIQFAGSVLSSGNVQGNQQSQYDQYVQIIGFIANIETASTTRWKVCT